MSEMLGVPDLLAMCDVAEQLAMLTDDLSAEQAVTLLEAAEKAHKALGDAIAMLKSRAIKVIEQPILVGSTAWSKKPTFKPRPQIAMIRKLVIDQSIEDCVDRETGEQSPRRAAEAAVAHMEELYVSPSTVPKTTGLKALGATVADVSQDEHTGYELKKVTL